MRPDAPYPLGLRTGPDRFIFFKRSGLDRTLFFLPAGIALRRKSTQLVIATNFPFRPAITGEKPRPPYPTKAAHTFQQTTPKKRRQSNKATKTQPVNNLQFAGD
ncbi:hypothetical protein [Blastopirellula retiformator]|uniref:hypothetical protein n=1 Tax=Blastopirellula retiformator TaxID=2527970 RepID=UPI0011B62466|nr:hypothetical protein [Blastopirellula retiformator]